jgi:hypothetical protein
MFIVPNDINPSMMSPEAMLDNINFLMDQHCNGVDLRSALRSAIWHNGVFQFGEPEVEGPCATLTHWQGSDSPESYLKNMEDPGGRVLLERNNWVEAVIDYQVNSWGFRSGIEYDDVADHCIVALGCSFTFGVGLHDYQTWPSLLGKLLGVRVLNLGMPGHSLDLNSLWLTLEGHAIRNPIAVCVLEPPTGRVSWMSQNPLETKAYSHQLREIGESNPRIISNLLLNSLVHSYKNYHTVKNWADRKGVPLLWNRNLMNPHINSLARDLAHFGPEWHQSKANDFYTCLKNT